MNKIQNHFRNTIKIRKSFWWFLGWLGTASEMRVLFLLLEGPLPSAPALDSTSEWVWPKGPALSLLKLEGIKGLQPLQA